jgi:hypothetical protein
MSYTLIEIYRQFGGTYVLLPSPLALKMDAAYFSETSVNFYQTTWHHNPNDNISMYGKDLHSNNDLKLVFRICSFPIWTVTQAILGFLVVFLGLSGQTPE